MGGSTEEHTEPLLDCPDIEEGAIREKKFTSTKFYDRKPFFYAAVLWFMGSLLLFASLLLHPRSRGADTTIYSPVQDHVHYKTVVFAASSGKKTVYMEDPSPRVDKAWEDLYDFGISRITPSEAAQLPNATSRLSEDPSHYVTGLEVFHQLYCLNLIRKKLNPKYYVNDTAIRAEHCIDQLRQALMCSADTATIPWSWSKSQERTIASARTTHTCKDFDAIRDWARSRRVEGGFDKDTYVEGSAISD